MYVYGLMSIQARILVLVAVAGALPVLSACASVGAAPPAGILFSGAKGVGPGTQVLVSDGDRPGALTGESCAMGILGLASWGDMSVAGAKAAGGITQVDTLDYKTTDILGVIFQKHCTIITGSGNALSAEVPVIPQVAPVYAPQPGYPQPGYPQPGYPAPAAAPGQPGYPPPTPGQ